MPENSGFRVFATCDIGAEALDRLRQRGYELEVYPSPEPPPKKVILDKLRHGVDALITTLRDPIDAEVFEAGKGRLKVVAQCAVGFDNIDLTGFGARGIPVCNTPDYGTTEVADHALALMLALRRGTATYSDEVRCGGPSVRL